MLMMMIVLVVVVIVVPSATDTYSHEEDPASHFTLSGLWFTQNTLHTFCTWIY